MEELTEEKLLKQEFVPDMQDEMEEMLGNDPELAAFFVAWIKNSFNASLAYRSLHPNVSEVSARALGSRKLSKLTKVNISGVLQAFGLDVETYISQLKEGLNAMKWDDFTGEKEPDHKARRTYHEVLGRLLGIEK